MIKEKHVTRAATAALVVGLTVFGVRQTRADGIPGTNPITYSGTLEEGGVAVTGSRNLRLTIYDDATSTDGSHQRCTTAASGAEVSNGRFQVVLGNECTAVVQATPDLWLEVEVNGSSLGRTKIGAVPFAVEAQRANDLTPGAVNRLRPGVYRAVQGASAVSVADWVDLPDTRVAFTLTSSQDVDILASGEGTSAGAGTGGSRCGIRFLLDDVPVNGVYPVRSFDVVSQGIDVDWTAMWSWSALPAGAHTIRTQIQKLSPAATNCNTGGTRILVTTR